MRRPAFGCTASARPAAAGPCSIWDFQSAPGTSTADDHTLARVPLTGQRVYFLHGVHDYTVSYPLAKAYFEQLDAPVKGFYTFEQSAHSPLFEEPAKTCEIMAKDVLAGATGLADRW